MVASLIQKRTIQSAHDISEGGLMITLLESAFFNNKGFDVSSNNSDLRKDAYWLGEAQSRVVVSCAADQVAGIEQLAKTFGIATATIGKVTGGEVMVDHEDWGSISNWKNEYDTAIEKKL